MTYINTSPAQSFISRTHSNIIIVHFMGESDSSIYGLGQNKLNLKYEQENAIQKYKTRQQIELPSTRSTAW